jgi:hypothetical protein
MKCDHEFYINYVREDMMKKMFSAVYSNNNICRHCNKSILDIPRNEIDECNPNLGKVFEIYFNEQLQEILS